MTYPKTILTKPIRRGIMIFLFVIFFVVSPLVIMYTAGYRYDFSTGQIEQTGVLSIDAKPNDIQVFLNNVKVNKNMPIRLSNRAPGNYTLLLQKSGYQDWSKEISIESRKTTYVRDITLFKQSLPIKILPTLDNITNLHTSFNGEYILVQTKNKNINELYLYKTATEDLTSIYRALENVEISWSPFANFFAIKTPTSIQITNANTPDTTQTYNFTTNITNLQWSNSEFSPLLYIQELNEINSFNLNKKELIFTLPFKTNIWYTKDNQNIWHYSEGKIKNEDKEYNLGNGVEKIININNNRIIYKTSSEIKILDFDNLDNNHNINATNHLYNSHTNEWLIWSPWELWSIYEDGRAELFDRTSEKIEFLYPLDKYGVLLLANENRITSFNPGYYITHELLSEVYIKQISANPNARKIFFLGNYSGVDGVFKLEY